MSDNQTNRNDDLFTPSLQAQPPTATTARQRPWRQQSQFWVAFFGGVLPYTVIAYLNGKRLGMAEAQQRQVLLLGAVGLVATVVADYLLFTGGLFEGARPSTILRFASRIVAVGVYLVISQMQKSADRVAAYAGNDAYDSLWKPGLAVTIGLGLLQNIVVYLIVTLLTGRSLIPGLV